MIHLLRVVCHIFGNTILAAINYERILDRLNKALDLDRFGDN